MKLETAIKKLIQRYEKAKKLSYIIDPVAFALYHTWKEADINRQKKEDKKW